jgi:hypothetical protein
MVKAAAHTIHFKRNLNLGEGHSWRDKTQAVCDCRAVQQASSRFGRTAGRAHAAGTRDQRGNKSEQRALLVIVER